MTQFPVVETGPDVTRQVLADHKDLIVVEVKIGAAGALRHHPHLQSTFVAAGRFKISIGDETREVGPGDSFIIPSDAVHAWICLEPGRLVDCVTPRQDDFL